MIERYVFPTTGNMASPTIFPKLPAMRILCRMAIITTRWRASVHAVDMTGLASDVCMLPSKRKARSAVIEIHVSPTACIMTFSTVPPKLAVVSVIFLVA